MPNDFYTRAYNPLPEQRVSSQVLKDEFARVEAGFDEVQGDANRAIKLPVGTADQTLAMDAGARANLVLAFDASGNITAISYGRYRGDWLTATAYVISDYFRDPSSKNIYSAVAAHTSGVLATDISAGRVQLAINVEDVEAAKTAAQNAATTATTQAGVATAQAGTATTQAGVATAQASTATTQAGVATTQAGIATSAAATATTQAGIATTKAAEAAASAASIAGGPVPEAPSDGKAYARKDASWVEDLGADIPALAGQALKNLRVKSDETGVEWTAEAAPGSIARTTKTAAYTLAAADKGALIDCSGTWTLGLAAAATLGAGWWCYVRNIGTGTITADPNASELIDGVTSGVIRPGMTLLVQCDGTAFHCVRAGPHVSSQLLTSGTSWVCPLGVRRPRVRGVGGGGGGKAYGSDGAASGSGGGGGYFEGFAAVTPGAVYSYSIGAAGAADTSSGGNTTFSATNGTFTANGGGIGGTFAGGPGGTASGPDAAVVIQGGTGIGAFTASTANGARGIGGDTPMSSYGVGGGGGGASANSGTQGAIILEY